MHTQRCDAQPCGRCKQAVIHRRRPAGPSMQQRLLTPWLQPCRRPLPHQQVPPRSLPAPPPSWPLQSSAGTDAYGVRHRSRRGWEQWHANLLPSVSGSLLEKGAACCRAHRAAGSGRRPAAAAAPLPLVLHAAPSLLPATTSLLVADSLQQGQGGSAERSCSRLLRSRRAGCRKPRP